MCTKDTRTDAFKMRSSCQSNNLQLGSSSGGNMDNDGCAEKRNLSLQKSSELEKKKGKLHVFLESYVYEK